ncbi:MAG: PIN domain nuclease [Epsilonproteobacteria bacterium]|nr:MAG: PIN domain nuclease [Campylobacterota bacterium]
MSGKLAFLDTNIFIYLIEENPLYLKQVYKLLDFLEKNDYEIITSTLTLGEILTKPYKDKRMDLVKTYKAFFTEMKLIELNSEIASLFAKVRADYKIKTPDAVQLASAVYAKANLFVTNDDRLSRFESEECRVVLLGEVYKV